MDMREIKNDRNFFWTNHAKNKLFQYGLSPTAVKNVLRAPERTEDVVAPETSALMKRKDTKKTKREIWVMIQKVAKSHKKKIISAWIYPGVSPEGKEIFVPEDVLAALGE